MKSATGILCVAVLTIIAIAGCSPATVESHSSHDARHDEASFARGPHGGRLLEDGSFTVEVVIVEAGIPPELHLYAFDNGEPLSPDEFGAAVELSRLGGIRDLFEFVPEGDYLRGLGVVREPHSFDVSVTASYSGNAHTWEYESHEGRTRIPERIAAEAGIETEPAGPQTIIETVELTGTVQANPGRVSEVSARFPGIVTEVRRDTGDVVSRGDVLARIETNDSLRPLAVTAPIDGLIVDRNIQIGQITGAEPLYVLADLSEVWIQLDVFGRDLGRVSAGQPVTVTTLDGNRHDGVIDFVSPLVAHGSQSVRARVPLDNTAGLLRAGQFISARVVVAETDVPLAVRRDALQTFRDFDVVYSRVGEVYEVRMLELGRRNGEYVEVLGGLNPGEVYVSANSFLIKADIEKSGASHDH
jgi:cobalt-zinc-cadmium efflux system membrane fusion protein